MVRGSLPAPLFGTREGAFSSPEHGWVRSYLISCGTRQRKPFFAEIGGRCGGFCRMRRSGSCDKSGPAGEWEAFRTEAGGPRQRYIPHRQNLPVFYLPVF